MWYSFLERYTLASMHQHTDGKLLALSAVDIAPRTTLDRLQSRWTYEMKASVLNQKQQANVKRQVEIMYIADSTTELSLVESAKTPAQI